VLCLLPNDAQIIQAGKNTILVTLMTGILMGLVLLYVKFKNPEAAFTHTLNELRYYINCGIVVLICTAAFMVTPNRKATLIGFLSTIPLHLIIIFAFPDMNYFVRAMWVILIAMTFVFTASAKDGFRTWKELIQYDSPDVLRAGGILAASLVLVHIVFH